MMLLAAMVTAHTGSYKRVRLRRPPFVLFEFSNLGRTQFTMSLARRFSDKKCRPKRFLGTPRYKKPRLDPETEREPESEVEEEPPPFRSVSRTKLAGTDGSGVVCGTFGMPLRPRKDISASSGNASVLEPAPRSWVLTGNRIVGCDRLVALMSGLRHCRESLSVFEDASTRRGLVTRMGVRCGCGWSQYISDSYNPVDYRLNLQSVLAGRMIGKGAVALETLFSFMGLPPSVGSNAHSRLSNKILVASNASVQAEYLSSANQLHAMSAAGTLFIAPPLVETDIEVADGEEVVDSDDESEGDPQSDVDPSEVSDDDDDDQLGDSTGDDDHSHSDHEDESSDEDDSSDDGTYLGRVWRSDPLDITVTFDGTWSKRGFTAIYGVMVVISWDTGRVLDAHVLSKFCGSCSRMRTRLGETSLEFRKWYKRHKKRCTVNHKGSSPAMEMQGALVLWRRSVERLNLRYTTVVSDGDSKTVRNLNVEEPYGEGVNIEKHECVGHVQKRIGKACINLRTKPPMETVEVVEKKAIKARKATKKRLAREAVPAVMKTVTRKVKVGGKGGLTKSKYEILQKFYGNAIRAHAGDIDGMVDACWALYYHTVSTDAEPQHDHCPKGEHSWCMYQRALAMNDPTPPHKDPKDSARLIPLRLKEHVKPIFEKLCRRSLLERCVLSATQNQNESFNKVVWQRCSKTDFASPETVQLAVGIAVLTFNDGMKSLTSVTERLGIRADPFLQNFIRSHDVFRIKRADAKGSAVSKKKRRAEHRRKAADEERRLEREGPTYEAGGF